VNKYKKRNEVGFVGISRDASAWITL